LNTNWMWDVRKALPVTMARKGTPGGVRGGQASSLWHFQKYGKLKPDRQKPVLRRLFQRSLQDGQALLGALPQCVVPVAGILLA
jgi:hypothetical protein